jgi:hypothetical protein
MTRDTPDEVEVKRVQGLIEAQPILAVLRANGIPARTRGEALGAIYALTLDGLAEVAILVPADRAEEARELLAAGEHGDLALRENEPGEGPEPQDG